MPKQVYGVQDDAGLYAAGALLFASYLLEMGLSDTEVLARLGGRFPDAPVDALNQVLQTTLQGQQAFNELPLITPGFTITPTAIPMIPGVEIGGYAIEVVTAIDEEGNEQGIRRIIESEKELTWEDIKRAGIPVTEEIFEKYKADFQRRGWTKLQTVDVQVIPIVAWRKLP